MRLAWWKLVTGRFEGRKTVLESFYYVTKYNIISL